MGAMKPMNSWILCAALSLAGTLAASPAAAQRHAGASEASVLSLSALPVAVSVLAPVALLSAGGTLVVVGVEASAAGTVWVLERASDGVRASVTLGAHAAGAASVAVGTALTATAFSAGWVLHQAGRAVAYIPNEVGRALLYQERVTR
jgi:hypothetical protein